MFLSKPERPVLLEAQHERRIVPKSASICKSRRFTSLIHHLPAHTSNLLSQQDCENLGADGSATVRKTPLVTSDAKATSFTAKYTAESGLHCVDLGYCYRPAKGKTSITITVGGSTAVITVPVGLPTQTLLPQASSEPVIVFTPEKKKREEVVEVRQMTKRSGKLGGGEAVRGGWTW
jgi:hypothetical protein